MHSSFDSLGSLSPEEKRRLLAQLMREKSKRTKTVPLSFAQQRLWFLDQLEPESVVYNIGLAARIKSKVQVRVLERSMRELVRRHESLRTTFSVREGTPLQVIHPQPTVALPFCDLRGLTEAEQLASALQLFRQDTQRPFQLSIGPLLRSTLLCLNDEQYALLLSMHHIILDAWSLTILMHELVSLYEAFVQGRPSPLKPLPLQYADFALWQRNWLQGEVLQAHLDYWKRQLNNATPLELPTDYPRPTVSNHRGADHTFMLPLELSNELLALSRQQGMSLFMLLLTAFQILLYRSTGQTDIVVGSDIANRTHMETEGLIGFFVNLLALRARVDGTFSFRSLLHQVRTMVLDAYTYQHLPFAMLVEHLHIGRERRQMPLAQVLFVLQNAPRTTTNEAGMKLELLPAETTTARFDLAMFMQEGSAGISGTAVYSTELFKRETVVALVHRFEVLLHSIVERPDVSIDLLDLYTPTEKDALAEEKNAQRKARKRTLKQAKGKEIEIV
jgi:hypothetical protein